MLRKLEELLPDQWLAAQSQSQKNERVILLPSDLGAGFQRLPS